MKQDPLDILEHLIKLGETPGNNTWLCQCTKELRTVRAELVRLKKQQANQLWLPCIAGEVTVKPVINWQAEQKEPTR